MPCMCGDIYCSSCGPAQGNYRCPNCGKWTDEGGCDNPDGCNAAVNAAYEGMAIDDAVCDIADLLAQNAGTWIGEWEGSSAGWWQRVQKRPLDKLQHTRNCLKALIKKKKEKK